MIKILDSKSKNFDTSLERLLSQRKKKIQFNPASVIKIVNDNILDKLIVRFCACLNFVWFRYRTSVW